MFYCPYENITNNYYRAMQMNSYIRVFHASPNSPAVDVYANGNLIVKGLTYGKLSQYIPVPSGNYNIKVYPSGQMTTPVINTNLYIPENTVTNIAAIGVLPNISLFPIQEPITAQTSGKSCVRFIHLSPNAPAVDIKLADGTTVFNNVAYKGITNYVNVPKGTYTFKVSPTGTNNVVLTVPNIELSSDNYYTIYAIGLVGKTPALEAIAVLEPR
ncbi:DUF4397 domain-containing protein [Clostridium lacusfryxellense]|uniref:DUF4397 domain-containing protein n=1 Tax=Clostridium lacusfryxellense TaxID=205328 RepID=UPI001C0AB42F|nr:DUF4397 domain-containing protein [Clostridium lacusfryxellense]MBU3113403.1 DUF4397 domain-containing protein [Clostridium lacusfryxellense]